MDKLANNLPKRLTVACCLGKDCGNTEVYLDGTLDGSELKYIYKRVSNNDEYTIPMDLEELTEWLKNIPINNLAEEKKG